MTHRMIVTVARAEGICSAGIQKGDKLIMVSPGADLSRTDHLCMYAISALMGKPSKFGIWSWWRTW